MVDYVPAAVIAAHLRRELKTAFPGTKFTVRARHFTSIDVDWHDGPTVEQVRPHTAGLTLSMGVWGEIAASDPVTVTGNKGVTYTGRPSVEYLFLNRRYSPETLAQAESIWVAETGKDPHAGEWQRSFKADGGWVSEGTVMSQVNEIAERIVKAAKVGG